MYINVCEILSKQAKEIPNNAAIITEKEVVTYRELDTISSNMGAKLLSLLNGEFKKPIVVFMEKTAECLISFYGVVKSGNFYVCIDSKMAPERVKSIFNTLNPSAVIVKNQDDIDGGIDCPCFTYDELIECEITEDERNTQAESSTKIIDTDPLYVLFTSGSTGVPKGSVINHKSVLAYAEWVVETFNLNTETNFGSQTPFYFSMSVLDIYSSLLCGGSITLIPKVYFSFPVKLLQYLNEKKVNTIYWVPSALSIIANINALEYVKVPGIKKVLFAGEVMPTRQLNYWRKHIPNALYANLFGPTEITDIALYYILDREFRDDEPIPIGRVCRNMDAFAINENGERIDKNEEGELYFRGSFVGMGYYNAPEKTSEFFVQNPLNKSYPEIVYKTGDIVKINDRDEYVYVGRKDFQIKHMGYRIELGEIENAAMANDKVEACACVYDKLRDNIILVYQGKIPEEDLAKHLNEYLPDYMRPGQIKNIKTMPHNANGKIDRQKLKQEYTKE